VTYLLRHSLGEVPAASSGPYFVADLSAWEGAMPDFPALANDPRMVGCIIKATQGTTYAPPWFMANWSRVRDAGSSRYGDSWFRGCYHFGTPTPSGADQADYLLAAVETAGGWDSGDMPPAWDLEGPPWTSAQQIIDVSSQFCDRIKQLTGKTPILYTGATWRQYGITDKCGFSQMWSSHLDVMAPYGWPNSSYALWQYGGDGKYYDPATAAFGYPTTIGGLGAIDMSVVMDGGAPATSLDQVRSALLNRGSWLAPLVLGAGLIALIAIASRYRAGEWV
jgi:hypothetical protein